METLFFVTNNNEDFLKRKFIVDETLSSDNSNYHFAGYPSPEVLSLMQTSYEGQDNYEIWECSSIVDNCPQDGIRSFCNQITPIKTHEVPTFTNEQRIAFAMLNTLYSTTNETYTK